MFSSNHSSFFLTSLCTLPYPQGLAHGKCTLIMCWMLEWMKKLDKWISGVDCRGSGCPGWEARINYCKVPSKPTMIQQFWEWVLFLRTEGRCLLHKSSRISCLFCHLPCSFLLVPSSCLCPSVHRSCESRVLLTALPRILWLYPVFLFPPPSVNSSIIVPWGTQTSSSLLSHSSSHCNRSFSLKAAVTLPLSCPNPYPPLTWHT